MLDTNHLSMPSNRCERGDALRPRPFLFTFLDLSNDLNLGSHFENHYNPLPSYYLDSDDGLKPNLRTFGYTWLLTSAGTAPGQFGDLGNVGVGKTVYREAKRRKSKKERSKRNLRVNESSPGFGLVSVPVRVEFLNDSGINGYEP